MPERSTTDSSELNLGGALSKWSGGSNNLLLLCIAKTIRTMGFGAISIVLALFLLQRGFSSAEVGMLLSATLLEDAFVTTLSAAFANKVGVRNVLYIACAVIVCGGIILSTAESKLVLLFAVTCGIVSPAGYEGGPFAPLEQTIISASTTSEQLTGAFSWYNMVGFGGAAIGALLAGICVAAMSSAPVVQAYQTIFLIYAAGGIVLAILYSMVKFAPHAQSVKTQFQQDIKPSTDISNSAPRETNSNETETSQASTGLGLAEGLEEKTESQTSPPSSKKFIYQLAALQSLDAFGGGFIVQSLLTLWFYQRYQVDATFLGPVYFCCNVIAALSFFFAPMIVKKVGLLNTMVFTHLPTSLALCLMPFLPNAWFAAGLLLLRSAFSSMDIPVRQAYTMLIVAEKDRPFAAGLTTSARAIAQGIAPTLTGFLLQNVTTGLPLILAGAFKSIYDVSLYFCFKNVPVHQDHEAPKVVARAG
ncbi:MAG: MFS transporter [Candidatus Melainabacteria bacterium]|nr:MFS transporter [Candidatus Melainabacteria bacterium]